ncbi:MAG: hypothetical protein AB1758_04780 [Candidatus Eremiobacterota bacterium]
MLRSPRAIPSLAIFSVIALTLDLVVSFMIVSQDDGPGPLMLFQIVWFLSWLGCLDGLHWIANESPWAHRRGPRTLEELRDALQPQQSEAEPLEDLTSEPGIFDIQSRVARLKRFDVMAWRGLFLRVLSGCSLVFMSCTLFLIYLAPHFPEFTLAFLIWTLLIFIRTTALGAGALILVPACLAIGAFGRRNTRGDYFHGGVAFGASALALFQIWAINQPPVEDFLMAVIQVGTNILSYPYGIMLGSFVWWVVSSVSGAGRE